MVEIVVYFQYDGEWTTKEDGEYKWCSRNKDIKTIILDDEKNVKLSELVDSIFERLRVDRTSTELKVGYIPLSAKKSGPKFILDDFDVKCYLLDRCGISKRRSMLHVELIKKDECTHGNDKRELKDEGRERCKNEKEAIIRDEYFNINMEASRVYDATSALVCKGDSLNEPTIEEHLHQETTASTTTPNPQPSCDIATNNCELVAINNKRISYSFNDGIDIAIGQVFASKDEVKNLVLNASLKACFDFKVVKSTTTLFVAKCVVQGCKWALRAARTTDSERFSIRTHHNIHTCPSSVNRRCLQVSSELVADVLRKDFPGQLDTPCPSSIMDMMKNRGMAVSYYKAWRGKRIASGDIKGASDPSFETIPTIKRRRASRKEILEKKKAIEEVVKAAIAEKDPLSFLPAFCCYRRDDLSICLGSGRGDELSSSVKKYIQNLLKANMEGPYGLEWPEEEKVKRREMVAGEACYVFAYEALNTNACESSTSSEVERSFTNCQADKGPLVGFVHYRFIMEEELPVLYVYELQLESRVQGKGLGKFLMQLMELIAQKNHMVAVLLTVQKANLGAMNFYMSKLRYVVSTTSPSRVDPLIGIQKSYEILCKTFDHEVSAILADENVGLKLSNL